MIPLKRVVISDLEREVMKQSDDNLLKMGDMEVLYHGIT